MKSVVYTRFCRFSFPFLQKIFYIGLSEISVQFDENNDRFKHIVGNILPRSIFFSFFGKAFFLKPVFRRGLPYSWYYHYIEYQYSKYWVMILVPDSPLDNSTRNSTIRCPYRFKHNGHVLLRLALLQYYTTVLVLTTKVTCVRRKMCLRQPTGDKKL